MVYLICMLSRLLKKLWKNVHEIFGGVDLGGQGTLNYILGMIQVRAGIHNHFFSICENCEI